MSEYADDVMQGVADRALGEWALPGASAELVARSENVVFRVDAGTRSYVLRIHRPGYHTLAELESEQLWTQALNVAGVHAPVGQPTRDGSHYAVVAVPGTDEVRHVGLSPWFDGIPLETLIEEASDEATRSGHFAQLGGLIAAMHNQAVEWSVPETFERHALDADGFFGESPFWGQFWSVPELSAAQGELLARARRRLCEWVVDYGKDPRTYSVIHADLHARNVLASDGRLHVIDFDDAGYGWHLYDLAVALWDYQDSSTFRAVRDPLIDGYRSQRALADDEIARLPMFLIIRGLVSIGWLSHRPEVDLHALLPALIEAECERAETFLT